MKLIFTCILIFVFSVSWAQGPVNLSSSEIFIKLKQLENTASVLYIAAHPDDENTRLLSYLVSERKVRTGYLSITRGDGGQNLIGDEQGIDLGLIRTQELLAARRIDGAQQFFTRAFDFGYSKSPEEALKIWGHQAVLADVVYIIRNFKPDVIITRFPTTGEGGHGHHTASAILAEEAFAAAADATKFPEQLIQNGGSLTVWQTKSLFWNSFNFGGNNTQSEDQLKMQVGLYNELLGKSYGEIAAESRSQHKSQGFGRSANRGPAKEYFKFIAGASATNDILENVPQQWSETSLSLWQPMVSEILANYNFKHPEASVEALVHLYERLQSLAPTALVKQKTEAVVELIEACSGLFFEVYTTVPNVAVGDSLKVHYQMLNPLQSPLKNVQIKMFNTNLLLPVPQQEPVVEGAKNIFISASQEVYQPYWLQYPKKIGHYEIKNAANLMFPENEPYAAQFSFELYGKEFLIKKPLRYKFTDPVNGEIYWPFLISYPLYMANEVPVVIFTNDNKITQKRIKINVQANMDLSGKFTLLQNNAEHSTVILDTVLTLAKDSRLVVPQLLNGKDFAANSSQFLSNQIQMPALYENQYFGLREIKYPHIPIQRYHFLSGVKVIKMDLKTSGSRAGYIAGAGDKIPEALAEMGYQVKILSEENVTEENLKNLDVIITGVRAYNMHEWLSQKYDVLMNYVKNGGVLLVQYNTNNSIGPIKAKMAPYPLHITRTRVTDENAEVTFLMPENSLMNFPNKITAKDFEGWVQERSIYHAEDETGKYQKLFSLHDPGEKPSEGSLLVANYGKGRFIYSGLVFFRELPAAVTGAYRLFANLIANKR